MTLAPGTRLGRYEIRSKIGEGGMGEVYLAQDTKLDRKVALKILPAEVASKLDRMARFVREAKAAAALNHPHIAHIYEIGEADGQHFIAMEFVEGVTLREKIHREHTDLRKLLRYLQQVAEGLAKAHAAGIVHRDLKPDNVMIARDGYAKILDFGLAKLVEPQGQKADQGELESDQALSEVATAMLQQHSLPGTVMGTLGYMSPEQAQGRISEIDHRSDIFTFGCILFEAATRRKAFAGKDALDSLHNIVHAPTPVIKDLNPATPDDLQRIVRRCLAKDPDKRYQSIKEVAIELEEVGQEMTGVSELEYSVQPASSLESTTDSRASEQPKGAARQATAAGTAEPTHSSSSAEYLVNEIKRHRRAAVLGLLAVVVVAAGVAFAIYKFAGRKSAAPAAAMKVTKLTSNGKASRAALSPDGKFVVYVLTESGKQSIWLRLVDDPSSTTQLVPPTEAPLPGFISLTFAPDGKSVYYNKAEGSGDDRTSYTLYQVPVLGGAARKLIENIGGRSILSHDGRRFAFPRTSSDRIGMALMIANVDGTGERTIKQASLVDRRLPLAWSPDGQAVACRARATSALGDQLIEVRVTDASERPISQQSWVNVDGAEWLPDGSGIILVARDQLADSAQIWHVDYSSGEARQITHDVSGYAGLSRSADSSALVTTQSEQDLNIWVLPQADWNRARPATSGKHSLSSLSWTPDNKLVYMMSNGPVTEIWVTEPDGTGQRRLAAGDSEYYHTMVSPDGRYIVFGSLAKVWRMDMDGANRKQLTTSWGLYPQCSPDNKWVIYTAADPGQANNLMRVPFDGGEPVRLTDYLVEEAVISPDGKWIAGNYREDTNSTWKIAIIPFDGGPPAKVLDIPGTGFRRIRWAADGRTLFYFDDRAGVSNLWSVSLSGGKPVQLTDFKDGIIRGLAWSRDGQQLAISRGTLNSDVVLIQNLR